MPSPKSTWLYNWGVRQITPLNSINMRLQTARNCKPSINHLHAHLQPQCMVVLKPNFRTMKSEMKTLGLLWDNDRNLYHSQTPTRTHIRPILEYNFLVCSPSSFLGSISQTENSQRGFTNRECQNVPYYIACLNQWQPQGSVTIEHYVETPIIVSNHFSGWLGTD